MSLVNQMLRDLELRQSGQPAADGAVLRDIGAVHEPLATDTRSSPWRVFAVVLLIAAGAAALAVALASTPMPRLSWPHSERASHDAERGFRSVVQPLPVSPAVALLAEVHPPLPPADAAASPATAPVPPLASASARAVPASPGDDATRRRPGETLVLGGLRLVRELTSLAKTDRHHAAVDAAPPAESPPKPAEAALPADLQALAKRFDDEFAAGLEADAGAAAPPPAAVPLKVKTAVRESASERAGSIYTQAARALATGRRDLAEPRLAEALRVDPSHVEARRLLATLLLQDARYEAAERLLAAGSPSAPTLAGLRARALVELGRDDEALTVLEPVLAGSRDAGLVAFEAALRQRLGDHAGASAAYRRVLAAQPGNGVWWMGLGISLEALAQPGEAREAYRRARASGRLRGPLREFVESRLAAL